MVGAVVVQDGTGDDKTAAVQVTVRDHAQQAGIAGTGDRMDRVVAEHVGAVSAGGGEELRHQGLTPMSQAGVSTSILS